MSSAPEHFSMCLLSDHITSFEKCLFIRLAHFLIGLLALLLSFFSPYILCILILYQICSVQIYSPIVLTASFLCCLFPFCVEASWYEAINSPIFAFVACASGVLSKKYLPLLMSCSVAAMFSSANLMASSLTFRFLIFNCELLFCIRCKVDVLLIISSQGVLVFPTPFLKRLFFFRK